MILKIKIFLFVLVSVFLASSNSCAQESQVEKQIEVSLRMVGHQVLLNLGDSTSRVLPIENTEGRYKIQFDTEFQFNPEELVATINQVVKETNLSHSYIVEVEECVTKKVVYSYQKGDFDDPNIIPCKTRAQPLGCYNLLFTLLDIENKIEPSTKPEENKLSYLLIIVAFIMVVGVLLFLRNRKSKSKVKPYIIALGKYRFDKRNAELIIEEQRIELTSKEADLLLLLYNSVNTTVEREVILNMVWADEGDYVGRTLDVFISKLRKKLEADTSVKIVNIRGVGYKLIIGE